MTVKRTKSLANSEDEKHFIKSMQEEMEELEISPIEVEFEPL